MNKIAFAQQINIALIHVHRKIRSVGLPASVVQIFIIAIFVFLLQSGSKHVLLFMALALPICLTVSFALAFAVRKAFKHHAPCCPACAKPIDLFNRRKAMATGLCPNCHSALFGP